MTDTSVGPSIFKVLDQVMLQVEYHCFFDYKYKQFKWIDPFYKELCLIIAEVLLLNTDSTIKINGIFISTKLVQEIYLQIRNHHVRLIFLNFRNVSSKIFNKKAYLRTALYNSFFEYEAQFINGTNIYDKTD
jgi:hypothetical protein